LLFAFISILLAFIIGNFINFLYDEVDGSVHPSWTHTRIAAMQLLLLLQ
jgi:hypothetical protein